MNRLCIFCKHFNLDTGSEGWSDWTPGSSMDMECYEDVWSFDLGDDFHALIKNAQNCGLYERSEFAIEMDAPE